MARVQDLLDRYQFMWRRKDTWMPYWQDLADIMLPEKGDFIRHHNPGDQRNDEIYDATPRLSARNLASALDGLLKPKTTKWFDPFVEDDALMENDEVKAHLAARRTHLWEAIYRPDGRFIQRSGETDMNLVIFGSGVLWQGENRNLDGLLFRSFHLKDIAFDENEEGRVDTLVLKSMLTPFQAIERYGALSVHEKIHEEIRQRKGKTQKKFPFVEVILPATDHDADKVFVRDMPYVSVTLDVEHEHIVREEGYVEFPAAVPRWETSPGEVYGRSPGMWALPDSRTLQAMGKTLLKGGQRAVDPPIWIAGDSAISPVRTFPGGVTVLDLTAAQGNSPIGALPSGADIPLGREMQNDYRTNVQAAFFEDKFNLPLEGPQMTATEILARKEQFVRALGPVFGRLEADYPEQVVKRADGIEERAGRMPPRPEALEEVEIKYRFNSPIQQTRKQLEVAGLSRALELITPLAQVQPEILDNFNGDEVTRDSPEWAGVPLQWLRTQEEVSSIREGRNQQAQQELLVQQAQQGASAIADIAKATRE